MCFRDWRSADGFYARAATNADALSRRKATFSVTRFIQRKPHFFLMIRCAVRSEVTRTGLRQSAMAESTQLKSPSFLPPETGRLVIRPADVPLHVERIVCKLDCGNRHLLLPVGAPGSVDMMIGFNDRRARRPYSFLRSARTASVSQISNSWPQPPQIISHSLVVRALRRFKSARHSGHSSCSFPLFVSDAMALFAEVYGGVAVIGAGQCRLSIFREETSVLLPRTGSSPRVPPKMTLPRNSDPTLSQLASALAMTETGNFMTC